ncbi:hypothetical protein C8R47DRAFT_1064147 [Mycena vitilis]|nr:hypothetical protein C8R47DRAFT_1064147 [Mycena vitilis]
MPCPRVPIARYRLRRFPSPRRPLDTDSSLSSIIPLAHIDPSVIVDDAHTRRAVSLDTPPAERSLGESNRYRLPRRASQVQGDLKALPSWGVRVDWGKAQQRSRLPFCARRSHIDIGATSAPAIRLERGRRCACIAIRTQDVRAHCASASRGISGRRGGHIALREGFHDRGRHVPGQRAMSPLLPLFRARTDGRPQWRWIRVEPGRRGVPYGHTSIDVRDPYARRGSGSHLAVGNELRQRAALGPTHRARTLHRSLPTQRSSDTIERVNLRQRAIPLHGARPRPLAGRFVDLSNGGAVAAASAQFPPWLDGVALSALPLVVRVYTAWIASKFQWLGGGRDAARRHCP